MLYFEKRLKVIFEGINQDRSRLTRSEKYGIMDDQEFFSVKEFAILIGVHYNTIIRSIKTGRLNAFRIGSGKKACYRISRSEIGRIALFDLEDLVSKIIEGKK